MREFLLFNKQFKTAFNLVVNASDEGSVGLLAGQRLPMGVNEGSPLPEGFNFVLKVAESVGGFITVRVVGAPIHGLVFVALVMSGSRMVWLRGGFIGGRFVGSGSWFVGSGSRFIGSGSRFIGSRFIGSGFIGSGFVGSGFVRGGFVGSRSVWVVSISHGHQNGQNSNTSLHCCEL